MPADAALAGRRILVVEDEYFLAEELRCALTAGGVTVLGPVPSVRAALDLIDRGEAPDAAMLDVSLGGDAAYPIADALTARGLPFLFTTGYDRSSMPARYAAVRRLEKPVELPLLMRELGRLLGGA